MSCCRGAPAPTCHRIFFRTRNATIRLSIYILSLSFTILQSLHPSTSLAIRRYTFQPDLHFLLLPRRFLRATIGPINIFFPSEGHASSFLRVVALESHELRCLFVTTSSSRAESGGPEPPSTPRKSFNEILESRSPKPSAAVKPGPIGSISRPRDEHPCRQEKEGKRERGMSAGVSGRRRWIARNEIVESEGSRWS